MQTARIPDNAHSSRKTARGRAVDDVVGVTAARKNDPSQRIRRQAQHGIDCADHVYFTHWDVGGEYSKHLVVKNVAMRTQKLRYRPLNTRAFSLDFPDSATLSAGMHWTIGITFRPAIEEECHDDLELVTSSGSFSITLKAMLPQHQLHLDSAIEFGFCPLKETSKRKFSLRNTGQLVSIFEWTVERPFRIVPEKGELLPGAEAQLTAEFRPEAAYCLVATATCCFGNALSWDKTHALKTMSITGVGKYPHISINAAEGNTEQTEESLFNFGDVPILSNSTRQFVLRNMSPVTAKFTINADRQHYDTVSYFKCSIYTGMVPAHGEVPFSITFIPSAVDTLVTERFTLCTIVGQSRHFMCSGRGAGSSVTLSVKHINFGEVELDTNTTKLFHIQNSSDFISYYQFLMEPLSIFQIDKVAGSLMPKTTVTLTVRFVPTESMNYYRRIYCLIEHQTPLLVNMLGTAYVGRHKPATLTLTLLDRYNARVREGLALFTPEELEQMIKTRAIEMGEQGLTWANGKSLTMDIIEETDEKLIGEALFQQIPALQCPVSILENMTDFGSCSRYRYIETRTVRIVNHTKGKMTCVWHLPRRPNGDKSVFSISPTACDIPAKGMIEFHASFQPDQDNTVFQQQLECFVHFKSMRNFRSVNEDTFTPPWCLTLSLLGNTMPTGDDSFVSQVVFGCPLLDFTGCMIRQTAYRTLSMTNVGDTTLLYAFSDQYETDAGLDSRQAVFSIYPRFGALQPGQRQLLLFSFTPQREHNYVRELRCIFNDNLANYQKLPVRGIGAIPAATINNGSPIAFPPTCIGTSRTKEFNIVNMSPLLCSYEWQIPEAYKHITILHPKKGILLPSHSTTVTCLFSPTEKRKYIVNLSLQYLSKGDTTASMSLCKATTVVMGVGMIGSVICRTPIKQLGATVVGVPDTGNHLLLENIEACDLTVFINIVDENEQQQDEVQCEQLTWRIPSRSTAQVDLKVNLREHKLKRFKARYQIVPHLQWQDMVETQQLAEQSIMNVSKTIKIEDAPWYDICDMVAQGVLPFVQIIGAASEQLSCSLMSAFFDYSQLNFALRSSVGNMITTDCEESFDFNFGASLQKTASTVVVVNLQNSGVIDVEWKFYYPQDLEIDIEPWANPHEYTEEKLNQTFIVENNIFSIEPRTGRLAPGDSCCVTLTYSHNHIGMHQLSLMFGQRQEPSSPFNRMVVINLKGQTVAPGVSHLQLHGTTQWLHSVQLTDTTPSVQICILENKGSIPLYYAIDTTPLDQIAKQYYNFPIFKCLKTTGKIAPGQTDAIQLLFSPIEGKEYRVDLPIRINEQTPSLITIIGEGMINQSERSAIQNARKTSSENNKVADYQLLQLSTHYIDFGDVLLRSIHRRLLTISNESTTAINFHWEATDTQGNIEPGARVVCKVTIFSQDQPQFHSVDIACVYVNKQKQASYDRLMSTLQKQRKPPPSLEGTDRPLSRSSTYDMRSKYVTLPPISPTTSRGDLRKLENKSADPVTSALETQLAQIEKPRVYRVYAMVVAHAITHMTSELENITQFTRELTLSTQTPISPLFPVVSQIMTSLLEDIYHDMHVQNYIQDLITQSPTIEEVFGKAMSNTGEHPLTNLAYFPDTSQGFQIPRLSARQTSLEDVLEQVIFDTVVDMS